VGSRAAHLFGGAAGDTRQRAALVIDVQQSRPATFHHRLQDARDPWWRGEWTDQENRSFLARVRRFQG